jgi:hypothetical protein
MQRFIIAACAALASISPTLAAPFTFTRLVGTGDPAPDGGSFTAVDSARGVDGSFSFRGSTASTSGMYIGPAGGPFTTIADTNTLIPGTAETFANFPIFYGTGNGRVFFTGSNAVNQTRGIYAYQSGALSVIADRTTPRPGGVGNFDSFGVTNASGAAAVFIGSGAANTDRAVYVAEGGGITRVADANTPITGTATKVGTANFVAIEGQDVAFSAGSGIYIRLGNDGTVKRVADLLFTPVPGLAPTSRFSMLGAPVLHDGAVTFSGHTNMQSVTPFTYGTYRYDLPSGPLTRIADATMDSPGGTGHLEDFHNVFAWGSGAVFDAYDISTYRGLYLRDAAGTIGEIIGGGDMLDGQQMNYAILSDLQGDTAYFTARFANGSEANYSVFLPEPAGMAVLAGAWLALRRRRGGICTKS